MWRLSLVGCTTCHLTASVSLCSSQTSTQGRSQDRRASSSCSTGSTSSELASRPIDESLLVFAQCGDGIYPQCFYCRHQARGECGANHHAGWSDERNQVEWLDRIKLRWHDAPQRHRRRRAHC